MARIVKIVKIVKDEDALPEELLTLSEAARRLGVSRKIVQTLVDRGQLTTVPVGDRVRVPASAVEAYAGLVERAAALARRINEAARPLPPPPTRKDSL